MNEENNVIVKTKNSKGLIILVVILVIVAIVLTGYIVYDKMNNKEPDKEIVETEKENVSTKENTEEENKEDNEELLKEITSVYEKAYDYINLSSYPSNFPENEEMKSYFTDKAINTISKGYHAYSIPSMDFMLYSILSATDQGKRPLTILTYTDDTIIATGQLIEGDPNTILDFDAYPLYIIFKKENNTYKIDMFE